MHHIGIDLGGTKIEVAVLATGHRVLWRERTPTEAHSGPERVLDNLRTLYRRAIVAVGQPAHTLGIGTPGAISPLTGLLKNSNTLCLNGLPLQTLLAECLEHPVTLENDANCFALAEALLGAGQGHRVVFGVIMGTGCGGGIVIDGHLLVGPQRIAGEWGHSTLDPAGPPCACGRRGCVETAISGSGLEARCRERFGRELGAEAIFADPDCSALVEDFYRDFGIALANVINILDPDCVVLGGGLSNLDDLYTRGVAAARARIFTDTPTTPILRNQLGDSAGVLGAALLGKASLPQPPGV
ncbi:MAG: ROK family protein [Rhodocyclaceae bacterium]|nr:ROK family protein [Rhodocyclaceae bacterium]